MAMDPDASAYTDEQIARIVHNLFVDIHDAVGEISPARWNDLPADAWQREDAMRQVRLVREGLTAQDDHEAWRSVREKAGWTLGDTFDPQQKRNPRLVKWEALPFRDRARALACFRTIRTLLGME
jgi:hypothetical protein